MCNIEQKKTEGLKRALGMMGLAVRAGKVVFGTPMVCDFIKDARERESILVLEAEDTSDNTHKRITDRCHYYGVRHMRIAVGTADLAHSLGKTGDLAVVAITDQKRAENVLRLLENQ